MKKKIVPIVLLMVAVVAVIELKNRKENACGESTCDVGVCALPIPLGMPESEFPEEVAAANPLPRLLDLGAGTCVPCKAMAPILDEMKETFAGRLEVVFIDVSKDEGAGKKYGVRMIPTQIFFDAAGNELFRHEGFFSRADMLSKWNELGYDFAERE